ncbi:putative PEP-binding protein [Streptomyces sp. NPDC090106]|uniref:putative PEP-binding protein n=1 Tax=Streptomyces sp. NPDC090106 TaxID=3365946 RepID=UPI00382D7516
MGQSVVCGGAIEDGLHGGSVGQEADELVQRVAEHPVLGAAHREEAADRLLDPSQPAVLDLVTTTAAAGRELGKPVGVCGESAADPVMALVLTGLGMTSLSTAPPALPAVRYALGRHTTEQCRQMARRALDASDAADARRGAATFVDEGALTMLDIFL